MSLWHLIIKEMAYRKMNFILVILNVAVAIGSLACSLLVLKAYDANTRKILEQKEAAMKSRLAVLDNEVRKTMLNLGFNIAIIPKGLNLGDFFAEDYASKYMPEESVQKLARSGIITIRHFLPSLQQKVIWPEAKRTIILIGTSGEVSDSQKNQEKPLIQPAPAGRIVLGYELHHSLGLKIGDKVRLLEKDFTLHKCNPEKGTKDDITAWISLREAQELLDKKGLINAIMALECMCAGPDPLAGLRAEIGKILPDTQIVEKRSEALVRWEARTRVAKEAEEAIAHERDNRARLKSQREQSAVMLISIVVIVAVVSIAGLGFRNVRDRRDEIGILRAIGFKSGQVLILFLSKSLLTGLIGGIVGLWCGIMAGDMLVMPNTGTGFTELLRFLDAELLVFALCVAVSLSVLAGWIPAMLAMHQDPAVILREE
jgi:putative ABC transport system permease protein